LEKIMKTLAFLAATAAAMTLASPAIAQETQTDAQTQEQSADQVQAAPTPVTQADLTPGTRVVGPNGEPVGTIVSADENGGVVSTGSASALLPFSNFTRTDDGSVMIAVSRAQFEQAVQAIPQQN
jgi:hypothetical protein